MPTGIQQLLRLASVDDGFRRELLEKRDEVAAAADVTLSTTEQAILRSVPTVQLAAMITSLPAPPADRRSFLQHIAATAVMVLLGSAALGSSCPTSTKTPRENPDAPRRVDNREMIKVGGAAPDRPPTRPTTRGMETEGGAAPDEPPPLREEHRMPAPGGAAPDIPRPRPPERPDAGVTRGIRPDLPKPKPKSPPED